MALKKQIIVKSPSYARLFYCRLFTDAGYLMVLIEKVKNHYASKASYVTSFGERFCTLNSLTISEVSEAFSKNIMEAKYSKKDMALRCRITRVQLVRTSC